MTMGSSSCLGDPLLEGHVGVAPVGPHLIGALRDQVVHLAPQALARSTCSCRSKHRYNHTVPEVVTVRTMKLNCK